MSSWGRRPGSPEGIEPSRAASAGSRGPARVVGGAIGLYQRWVSPVLPPACRYWPSCSEYARLAIARRGLLRGGVAALGRLLRCQPMFPGGVDPPR